MILLWLLILVLQNAAFTWVSRARNSASYGYHAIASVFSNGIFFVSQFIMIKAISMPQMNNSGTALTFGLLYVFGTVTGSVLMHYVSIKYLEKGKRKVGA